MRRSVGFALALVVLLSLVSVMPACAEKPVVTYWPYPSVDLEAGWLCPFPVTLAYEGDIRETVWYSEASLVDRGLWDASKLTVYWSANGKAVHVNSVSGIRFTVVHDDTGSTWSYACRGPDGFAVLPGEGPVTGGAGLMTWTVRCPGHTECVLDEGIEWEDFTRTGLEIWDTEAICGALAP